MLSCSSSDDANVEHFSNGYFCRSNRVSGIASCVQYWRQTKDGPRLVTDTVVENGMVKSFSATPVNWGCVMQFGDSSYLQVVSCGEFGSRQTPVVSVSVAENVVTLMDRQMEWPVFTNAIARLSGFEKCLTIVELSLPIEDVAFKKIINQLSKISQIGLAIVPSGLNPQKLHTLKEIEPTNAPYSSPAPQVQKR